MLGMGPAVPQHPHPGDGASTDVGAADTAEGGGQVASGVTQPPLNPRGNRAAQFGICGL